MELAIDVENVFAANLAKAMDRVAKSHVRLTEYLAVDLRSSEIVDRDADEGALERRLAEQQDRDFFAIISPAAD